MDFHTADGMGGPLKHETSAKCRASRSVKQSNSHNVVFSFSPACNASFPHICNDGHSCYSDVQKCDGTSQCNDGADEICGQLIYFTIDVQFSGKTLSWIYMFFSFKNFMSCSDYFDCLVSENYSSLGILTSPLIIFEIVLNQILYNYLNMWWQDLLSVFEKRPAPTPFLFKYRWWKSHPFKWMVKMTNDVPQGLVWGPICYFKFSSMTSSLRSISHVQGMIMQTPLVSWYQHFADKTRRRIQNHSQMVRQESHKINYQ